MNKKSKKKLDVLRKRIEKLQLALKGAKEQLDDPDEVVKLEADLAAAMAEVSKLKSE
jgi:hypothetical protein